VLLPLKVCEKRREESVVYVGFKSSSSSHADWLLLAGIILMENGQIERSGCGAPFGSGALPEPQKRH